MKIVFVSIWYSEGMGYIENCLPREMVRLGHEVHVVTSTAQVYYNHPYFEATYGQYLGAPLVEPKSYTETVFSESDGKSLEKGVEIHRLPFRRLAGRIILKGLATHIRAIQPDIVHTFEHSAVDTLRLVALKAQLKFKLFTANHASRLSIETSGSSTNILGKLTRFFLQYFPGRFISLFIEKCFCVTIDAAETAVDYFGVSPSKTQVTTLGTDTNFFKPNFQERLRIRQSLSISETDILCIFTGKFVEKTKNPLILAQAVANLRAKGHQISALFIGEGEQSAALTETKGSLVLPFMRHEDLLPYYQAADIAVYPFGESNSQLDATAVGLNLVLCTEVQAYQSVSSSDIFDETNAYKPKIVSYFYEYPSVPALEKVLLTLLDTDLRQKLQNLGRAEVTENFSWAAIAKRRIHDYEASRKIIKSNL
jgi:glycosyltransferase involved in cell wall biosynthesis